MDKQPESDSDKVTRFLKFVDEHRGCSVMVSSDVWEALKGVEGRASIPPGASLPIHGMYPLLSPGTMCAFDHEALFRDLLHPTRLI